jgi:hypothetical protein
MGRTRDVSKILTSNTSILSLASASTTYATKVSTGLNLINNTSFTAQSTVSINDVFSATYDDYKVIFHLDSTSSTSHEPVFRLRVGGADLSSSSYNGSAIFTSTTNVAAGSYSTTRTNWAFGDGAIAQGVTFFMELGNPFRTTGKHTAWWYNWGIAGGNDAMKLFLGQVAAGTSYTGFSIVNIGTGTITGSVSVYGYNK